MLGVNQVRVTFLLTIGYAMGPRRFARQLDMNARQLCLYCVRGESENGIVAENIRCDVLSDPLLANKLDTCSQMT